MTQDSREAFEAWGLTNSLPCPPYKDPIEWACFNAFKGGRASLLNELQSEEMVEVVTAALWKGQEGNWSGRDYAKAALQAISKRLGE